MVLGCWQRLGRKTTDLGALRRRWTAPHVVASDVFCFRGIGQSIGEAKGLAKGQETREETRGGFGTEPEYSMWQQPKGLVTGQVVRTARASLVSGDYNTLQLQLYPRNEQDMRQGPAAPCLLVS